VQPTTPRRSMGPESGPSVRGRPPAARRRVSPPGPLNPRAGWKTRDATPANSPTDGTPPPDASSPDGRFRGRGSAGGFLEPWSGNFARGDDGGHRHRLVDRVRGLQLHLELLLLMVRESQESGGSAAFGPLAILAEPRSLRCVCCGGDLGVREHSLLRVRPPPRLARVAVRSMDSLRNFPG